METAFNAYETIEYMVEHGNKSSITDAGVGGLCVHAAIQGAGMNVLVNAKDLATKEVAESMKARALELIELSTQKSEAIRTNVFIALGV
jgi:formiminotetrahydrofolate cyclodeaminase